MTRADLIATRDAAAIEFTIADAVHRREGTGATYRALEAARVDRRRAQDAVDATPEQIDASPKL